MKIPIVAVVLVVFVSLMSKMAQALLKCHGRKLACPSVSWTAIRMYSPSSSIMSSSTEETATAWSKYSAGRRSQRITNSRPDMALPASAASTSTTSSTSTTTPGVSSFKQKLLAKKRQDQVAAPKKATSKPTTPVAASGSVSDSKSGREKTQRPPADKVSASSSNDPKKSTERSKEVPKAAVSRPASTASAEDPLSLNRPFTLPSGEFRPKQSLGQNYLSDQNYINKIIDTFHSERTAAMKRDKQAGVDVQEDPSGKRVVEIGPGAGALTRSLSHRFKDMLAVEIDQRAVALLNDKIPKLNVLHQDVLQFDWAKHSMERDGKLSIVANLPYHIVSQVLFSLADNNEHISLAVVTMQYEVGDRITAAPKTVQYGIPSVVFQLYGKVKLNFKIPPTVFYPVPKVDSALVTIDFTKPHPDLHKVDPRNLRRVLSTAFRQRRKMLRQSLKELLISEKLTLPEKWSTLRPQELTPPQFIELTVDLYGERVLDDNTKSPVWRRSSLRTNAAQKNKEDDDDDLMMK